jgi:hypothetical protein
MKNNTLPFFKTLLIFSLLLISFGCKTISYRANNPESTYGVATGEEYFSIAVLPDTQYYTAIKNGGNMQMFENQIQWIRDNRKDQNIEYVIHLGDITDHNISLEWDRAKSVLYKLDEDNIPYGLSVGNHDETPNGNPSKGDEKTDYTKYFGKSHFKDRKWYGGGMGGNDNSDNHFDIFTANGEKFLALYFVYNEPGNKSYSEEYEAKTLKWADSVLTANADRRAILVTHSMLTRPKGSESNQKEGTGNNSVPSEYTKQGKQIYNMAKHHKNVFLTLGGHISGEGFRRDTYNGGTIKGYLTDYQFRENAPYGGVKDRNGGNGLLRLMKFNKTKQTLSVTSFSPKTNGQVVYETDGDSQFTEPLYQ